MTDDVRQRLTADEFGWLTTVTGSGQPVPKLVWFFFDGADIVVYTLPTTAKVRHVRQHPRVSLNLDSDGRGGGIIVIGGTATVDAEGADPREDGPYWEKYRDVAAAAGLADVMGNYDTRLRISIDRVWTTPTA